MHPHPPQPPHGHRQPYPPPPVVYVQQRGGSRATALGVWAIFLFIAAPVLLVAVCCGGLFLMGVFGGSPDAAPSPTP